MHQMTVRQLSQALKKGEFSSLELTQHYLKRIQKHQDLNAFTHLNEEEALASAKRADSLLKQKNASPLTGIPMAHKDIFCTKNMPTTCASKMLANYTSPFDATVVERLHAEGAVLLGKTNMDEFAMGSANENSCFGAVKNPWDKNRVPGGSSGGSAAAVAASLLPYASGTDTGGSIRQPAAFCGLSGLKPTYGLISRFGMVAYASSLDQAGPIAKTAEDLALVLQAMAGFDPKDSTSVDKGIPNYSEHLKQPLNPVRIGLPSCFFHSEVDAGIQDAIREAVKVYEKAGAEIVKLDLSLHNLWIPCYYVIACAEASSNLSRFDGIRFGHRTAHAKTLPELIERSRNEGFGDEVKRRILTGSYVLSAGYFDAYYLQALKIRRLIQNELLEALRSVDVILGPTTPTTAFGIGQKNSPVQNYLADTFTVAANLAGLPALSIPAGFSQGLPVGMQLMGSHFSEARLLTIAHHYQQLSTWHQSRPHE